LFSDLFWLLLSCSRCSIPSCYDANSVLFTIHCNFALNVSKTHFFFAKFTCFHSLVVRALDSCCKGHWFKSLLEQFI